MKKNYRNILGENLKRLIRNANLTQSEFATKLGIRPQHLSQWIGGEIKPSAKYLTAITEILNIPVAELTGRHITVDHATAYNIVAEDQRLPGLTEQTARLIIRQEVRSLLEEFLIEPAETRIEKTRQFVKHLVDKIKKPPKLTPTVSKRFDMNYEAIKRWKETDEVFEVSLEILMEFCLNYNLKDKQRRIEDVTEALRFMLGDKIIGGPDS